ncbi:MAG: WD40 repeat domain-containing protein [Gemmataceae bacterium]
MAYHRLLIGPTPAELVTALREATREANKPQTILDFADDWDDFVASLGGRRDGRRQWSDARRGDTAGVGVTWWTDHVGRRHVRVTGAGPQDPQRHHPTRNDPRPPLWHLYPDRVFYRERAGLGEWWGACGCGIAGRPEAIGWMGQTCGPCHDRAEEGGAVVGGAAGPLLHQIDRPPAFSPDGAMLAVILEYEPGAHQVRVHDLDDGTHVDLPRSPPLFSAPAFSFDGLIAFATEYHTLHVHDLTTGETLPLEDVAETRLHCLGFSPDGKYFAAGGPDGLLVWARQGDPSGWRVIGEVPGEVRALAFSQDRRRLAVGLEERLVLTDPAGRSRGKEIPGAVPAGQHIQGLAISPNGKELCVVTAPTVYSAGDQRPTVCRRRIDAADARAPVREVPRGISLLHLSPCGGYLSAVHRDEHAACVLDTTTGRELGSVGWDVAELVRSAVFSPDGRTLALVDATGTLKLVPWAALLG